MAHSPAIDIPRPEISAFCRRHHVRRLAVFGSVLRDDFAAGSDVDILVEFEPNHVPGFFDLEGMEIELTSLVGRDVDLNTLGFFSLDDHQKILDESVVLYCRD